MTGETPPQDGVAASPKGAGPQTAPLPFYRRSLFWVIIGMLIGGLVLFLLLRGCAPAPEGDGEGEAPGRSESRPPEPPQAPTPDPKAEADKKAERDAALKELLLVQKAQNQGLEEELRRLQALLQEDPCALPGILGAPPAEQHVAPGYS
ncbi:hypothetical protein LJC59_06400, partial [Desulfovibrio sp. OttesenSCG-928-A18]|nr:hypothetical protein [Desulfovibrio sp. OttesenSCG-928-A18]